MFDRKAHRKRDELSSFDMDGKARQAVSYTAISRCRVDRRTNNENNSATHETHAQIHDQTRRRNTDRGALGSCLASIAVVADVLHSVGFQGEWLLCQGTLEQPMHDDIRVATDGVGLKRGTRGGDWGGTGWGR